MDRHGLRKSARWIATGLERIGRERIGLEKIGRECRWLWISLRSAVRTAALFRFSAHSNTTTVDRPSMCSLRH